MRNDTSQRRDVLLTGATGHVGSCLLPLLQARGCHVRCLTRSPESAARKEPDCDWRRGDIEDESSLLAAMDGCGAAYYLVHQMSAGRGDYHKREVETALRFRRCAEAAGIRRIIYLGGTRPDGPPSRHLDSRLETGRILREGAVLTIELRASMLVGAGSASWTMVRDLAARLPAMVLPRWLRSRSAPLATGDAVAALAAALDLPLKESAWFDIPGPELMSGREMLERTASVMGLRRPLGVAVPVLTPSLSSYWILLVTRERGPLARELVDGLLHSMIPVDAAYWELIDHPKLTTFEDATRAALAEEAERGTGPTGMGAGWEGMIHRVWGLGQGSV